jgi:Flp pilus assembly protein TadG
MRLPHVRAVEKRAAHRGAAAVELAILLPVLVFSSMMAVDFAQVAYVQVTLQNCARNGALYEFYKKAGFSLPTGWTSLSAAASADAQSTYSSNSPTSGIANDASFSVAATSPASSANNYVTVTVTYVYKPMALPSVSSLPSISGSITLSQSATMPYPASQSAVP